MRKHSTSRRSFFKKTIGGVALGAAGSAFAPAVAQGSPALHTDIKLGVASYSLRKFSRDEAISMTRALDTPYINIKSFHLTHESTPQELAAGRKVFEDAGLKIVGGGTITIHEDTDEFVGSMFEYAKNCGMPLMVVAPKPEVLPRIEKFARQYDIMVAIHNHGPEDQYFPAPSDGLKLIKDMDPRMGLCVDVGHTARTGVDVVQSIADAGSRVLDLHMKDLANMSDRDSQVAVGEGKMPVAEIFKQLSKMDYQGYVNLEYEIFADDPLPGMKQSFAYMRGVLAGLNA